MKSFHKLYKSILQKLMFKNITIAGICRPLSLFLFALILAQLNPRLLLYFSIEASPNYFLFKPPLTIVFII